MSELKKSAELPFCDLVMKGGITSGVVYPKLIARLSGEYRFKNIGGTSAGAIAAAGCAAAEFRRHSGSHQGFDDLAKLPGELSDSVGNPPASRLRHLFQPSVALHKHFDVLLAALNQPSPTARVVSTLVALLRQYWAWALLAGAATFLVLVTLVRSSGAIPWWQAAGFSFVCLLVWLAAGWFGVLQRGRGTGTAPTLAALLWWLVGGVVLVAAGLVCLHGSARWGQALVAGAMAGVSWAIVLPLGIALAVALCGWQFTTTLLSGLHANFWGLCSGRTQQPGDSITGLTDWLTGYFNDIAGLKAEARPLTLGDLWEGRQLSDEVALSMKDDKAPLDRAINFEVMTTAVSQQMCYAIPFRVGSGAFYFDEKEWARLFPASVIAWLVKASDAEKAASDAERKRSNPEWKGSKEVTTEEGTLLRRLPSNRNLPVVLLVRMSLSFPILLSAVPMYAVDHSSDKTKGHAKRVWFSDGGISSNMPLHFFDAPLPGHPTFAVNLKAEHPDYPIVKDAPACQEGNGRVYLAQDNNAGRQLYWEPPADGSPQGLFSFLASIVKTMQNWRDEIQFPYPGYRDRIVQISQRDDEGGLNLDMPDSHIKALGEAGECAAEKITARFKPDAAAGPAAGGWENHKRIRLRTFLALAEELCRHPSLRDSQWDAVLANGSSLRYNAKEQALARKILDDLRAIGTAAQDSGVSLAEKAPKPRASLRISPRI